ncbi:Glucosamine-6-phosphate isomerase/6-phosphogluconolactonase superfamily [Verrucomicrobiia bacterium DG1235]|nr:Glucosamine-6-phosphate isomerase/6-phosphogluconolactonase superfamily [Verrucomicrobiae bacterium DG1235]
MNKPIKEVVNGTLKVSVYSTRQEMGAAAAEFVTTYLARLLEEKDEVRIVVGSAPSQDEFFAELVKSENNGRIDWTRVEVFHMDEYVGLRSAHPQSFRKYQKEHFLSHVSVKTFHEIHGEAMDTKVECRRLNALLAEKPIDLVCLGIGENGHLAFNDPPIADFDDPKWAKVVKLDDTCRQQQVNDGCFAALEEVPTHAITLTLKVFKDAACLSGVIPAKTKAAAVAAAVEGEIGTHCPATLCRLHSNARLFLDPNSASELSL